MKFVGIDLHKKSISLCVMDESRRVVSRARLDCRWTDRIREFFARLGPFPAVVEATASYEWLVVLIEPLAERIVLAHPKKMRVIAESACKTDKLDAQVLAQFLALDMIPEAHRPTPRVREHRRLVRHRVYVQGMCGGTQHSHQAKRPSRTRSTDADGEGNVREHPPPVPCTGPHSLTVI